MSFEVIAVERFKKEAKRLIKKYPSLKSELAQLARVLTDAPESGTSLGNDVYKIRLAVKSKGKGKSGGARVITYVVTNAQEVYLLSIYDKSEFDSIDDKILSTIIAQIKRAD